LHYCILDIRSSTSNIVIDLLKGKITPIEEPSSKWKANKDDPNDDLGPFTLFVRTFSFGFLLPLLSFLLVLGLNTKGLSQLGVVLGNAIATLYTAVIICMVGVGAGVINDECYGTITKLSSFIFVAEDCAFYPWDIIATCLGGFFIIQLGAAAILWKKLTRYNIGDHYITH
jgi:hypothetical protein